MRKATALQTLRTSVQAMFAREEVAKNAGKALLMTAGE